MLGSSNIIILHDIFVMKDLLESQNPNRADLHHTHWLLHLSEPSLRSMALPQTSQRLLRRKNNFGMKSFPRSFAVCNGDTCKNEPFHLCDFAFRGHMKYDSAVVTWPHFAVPTLAIRSDTSTSCTSSSLAIVGPGERTRSNPLMTVVPN